MKNYIIIISLILNSCIGAGVGDVSEELGGGYNFLAEGSCSTIYSDYVYKENIYPNIKKYAFDKKFILVQQTPSSKYVTSYIVQDLRDKYGLLLYRKDSIEMNKYVSKFMQSKIWKDSIWHREISREILPGNHVRSFDTLNIIASKIIKEDLYFQEMFSREVNYYIIDKQRQEIYGPFSKKNYLIKRKELKISETLIFDY